MGTYNLQRNPTLAPGEAFPNKPCESQYPGLHKWLLARPELHHHHQLGPPHAFFLILLLFFFPRIDDKRKGSPSNCLEDWKAERGRGQLYGGNETEALEAAGDCQSAFTRPECAVAGIKELAGQPLCRAGLSGSEWRRVTPRDQLYNSGQSKDYENVEELKQLCWRPSPLEKGCLVFTSGIRKP